MIGFRLLPRTRLFATLAVAIVPLRTAAPQGAALSAAAMFGRVPHGGAIAADSRESRATQCTVDAVLLGGPALRTASRPALRPASRVTSTVAAEVAVPSCIHHRLAFTAIAGLQPAFAPFQVDGYLAGAALSLPLNSGGVWIAYRSSVTAIGGSSAVTSGEVNVVNDSGRSERPAATMSRAPITELTAGASRQLGQIHLELSAGAAHGIVGAEVETPGRMVTDSVWTDTVGWLPQSHEIRGGRVASAVGAHWLTGELYASWTRAWFAAGASIGGWLAAARMPGTGFGSIELSARVLPNVWIIGSAGVAPDVTRPARPSGSFSTVGLRFVRARGAAFPGALTAPTAAGARAFTVAPLDSSSYIFSLRAPGAERVEMSGEFTGWKPVALVRAGEGLWVVRLSVAPGAYRANVRIDGGRWLAPPGTTAVADDFGGTAGLVIVPPR